MPTDVLWGVAAIILILLDSLGGSTTPMPRFTLTAFKYNEDSMRPEGMGIHKQEALLTDAWKTARDMLVLNDQAVFVEIYRDSQKIDTVTRKEL